MSVNRHLLYTIAFTTSFASMAFEILIARLISSFTQNYVLSQALTLSVFIVGLGLGSFLAGFMDQKKPATLLKLQILIFLTAVLALFLIPALNVYLSFSDFVKDDRVLLLLSLPQLPVLMIAVFAGTEIPFLTRMSDSGEAHRSTLGTILTLSYAASFAASLFSVRWLLPYLGFFNTYCLILLTVVTSCFLLSLTLEKRNSFYLLMIVLLSFFSGFLLKFSSPLQQIYLKNYYYGHAVHKKFWQVEELPPILSTSTVYQDIDIVPDLFRFSKTGDYLLYIDKKLQYSTQYEAVYHESMVHGSINLNQQAPRRVLILGGGDGLIARELLKYTEIEKIDLVELDRLMIHLGQSHVLFTKQNQNSLNDQRVQVINADAYTWIRQSQDTYDAVYIDFPHPFSVELSRLYSFEFYSFLKKRLSPEGFVILDFPANHLTSGELSYYPKSKPTILQDTLAVAGFTKPFIFGPKESFIFVSLKNKTPAFNEEALFKRVSTKTWSNLSEINFLKEAETLQTPTSDHSVNSIFRPYFLIE